MFYVESITIPAPKPSLLSRFMKSINRLGYLRAASELERMGYREEAKRVMQQLNSL